MILITFRFMNDAISHSITTLGAKHPPKDYISYLYLYVLMEIDQWIEKLRKEEKLIIVEGIKDKRALENIGLKNIVTLKKPLYAVVEEIASKAKEVIILTDLDPKGKELYARLSKDLQKHGVKIDNAFREFLFKETKLRQIEGLVHYLHKL